MECKIIKLITVLINLCKKDKVYLPVKAAAILGNDGVIYSLEPPNRHYHIGRYMVDQYSYPPPFPGGSKQGFILTDNTFVDRRTAYIHAKLNYQIIHEIKIPNPRLFSEHLW